jgi:acyl-CoA synthetase (NDP forming)
MSRALYRHADLQRMMNPASIAIVGASGRAGSFGQRLEANLAHFSGRLYLINANYTQLGERPCYPSLSALPEVPDCVVISAPREAVEGVLEECAALKVGGAVLFASGFAETGKPERIAQQKRIVQLAQKAGVRLIGPNCIGLANFRLGAVMTFSGTPVVESVRDASIGLVSQSGALGFALSQAIERGVSFSHVLTSGNSADVDVADYVAFLAEDPGCKVIACVFEGMSDPLRFIEAAHIARRAGKPLVVYKIATGEQGAAAAMSHTGSLAGSTEAYVAAFEQAGIILVEEFDWLIETAAFFAKAEAPKAAGVAVVSTSGGAAIMAADKAELRGVPLPQPGPAADAVLKARIPEFGSPRNPCDITAQVLSDPESLHACADALLADPAYGALVMPFVYAYQVAVPRLTMLNDLARKHGKTACVVWLTEWLEGPGAREAESSEKVAVFRSMASCIAALDQWQRWSAGPAASAAATDAAATIGAGSAGAVRAQLEQAGSPVLTERESKAALAAYGVPMVDDHLVRSADEAVAAAMRCGYPVVLKAESAAIPHKTEAGVVRLALANEAAVRAAYAAIMDNARKVAPPEAINGVLVQRMVPSGVEVIVGARIDPLFGPLIVVGLGGILVELMQDSAVALAPLSREAARGLIQRLKGVRLLTGFRGSEPVDLDRLADIVCRVAQFASDHRERLVELDVNPLICAGRDIVGVDALIRLRTPE